MPDMADWVNDDTPDFISGDFGPDEIEIDLTHAAVNPLPDVPSWLETESKNVYDLYSAGSMDKARFLIDAHWVKEFKPGWWTVQGSERYTVQVLENPYHGVPWTTCTCPNGQNRSSRPTCYHSAAVLLTHLGLYEPINNTEK